MRCSSGARRWSVPEPVEGGIGGNPEGPEVAIRAASRREVRAGGTDHRRRVVRALHQRPASAGQGDRRDRRSGRGAKDPAEVGSRKGDRQDRDRGDRREDRAHPAKNGRRTTARKLRTLDGEFRNAVFGQDKAIEALVSAIRLARAGLGNPGSRSATSCSAVRRGRKDRGRSPARVLLGVEYPLRHVGVHGDTRRVASDRRASGLRRVRPGRPADRCDQQAPVQGGPPRRNQKAHPDIFNILLQVMDLGSLTDNNGRKTDFRNMIVILTTNAGAGDHDGGGSGFSNGRQAGDEMAEIKRMFPPEFRNPGRDDFVRLLDQEVILLVVDKFLLELEERLHEKKVDSVVLAEAARVPGAAAVRYQMGARPMGSPHPGHDPPEALADELLFGRLVNGGQGDDRHRRRRTRSSSRSRKRSNPKKSRKRFARRKVPHALDGSACARARLAQHVPLYMARAHAKPSGFAGAVGCRQAAGSWNSRTLICAAS